MNKINRKYSILCMLMLIVLAVSLLIIFGTLPCREYKNLVFDRDNPGELPNAFSNRWIECPSDCRVFVLEALLEKTLSHGDYCTDELVNQIGLNRENARQILGEPRYQSANMLYYEIGPLSSEYTPSDRIGRFFVGSSNDIKLVFSDRGKLEFAEIID